MKNNHRSYSTGFGDQAFEIECNNEDAYSIAEFLFLDFPGATATPTKHYCIVSSGPVPILSLWDGDKRLYFGKSKYRLAYTLMNEVIFHCINTNDSHHALHAGVVCKEDRCILLPGKSGSGKSTLTSWLIMNGFQYLTDELVFLSADAQVLPMTRPISLKVNSSHETWLLSENVNGEMITCDTGSMISHRSLNPLFEARQPKVTEVIFPKYKPGGKPGLNEISPAKSSLYLLQSHVNARNLNGHGVSELAAIVKKCQSFILTYGNFDDLRKIFNSDLELS
jgi:hypothetical protein